jgi:hypothetical protein
MCEPLLSEESAKQLKLEEGDSGFIDLCLCLFTLGDTLTPDERLGLDAISAELHANPNAPILTPLEALVVKDFLECARERTSRGKARIARILKQIEAEF